MSDGVFNFNFLALVFSEILGGPKFTLGGPTPLDAPNRRNFSTQSEYFTISNCVFNFNIQLQHFPRFQGGPKFTLGGPAPPVSPQRKNICTQGQYFTRFNGVFNFNFLALVFSEILGDPKFTLEGPTPHGLPLADFFFLLHKAITSQYLIVFLISTFQLQQFPRF